MQHWPEIAGVIGESRIHEIAPWEQQDQDSHQTRYEPVIAYDYFVDGHEYRGRRVGDGMTSASWRSFAESRVAAYPVGRPVRVFVNPTTPRDAILERETAPRGAVVLIAVGAAMVIGGLWWGFARGAH